MEGSTTWEKTRQIQVGKRYRLARKQLGLSQPEVSEQSGIPQSTFSRLENGGEPKETPKIREFYLARGIPEDHFDVSPDRYDYLERRIEELEQLFKEKLKLLDKTIDLYQELLKGGD